MAVNVSAWDKLWNKVRYGWGLEQVNDWHFFLDVSHWMGKGNLETAQAQARSRGVELAAIVYKATDFTATGSSAWVDSTASHYHTEANRLGIKNGAYHWLQPKVDPTVQARYYLDKWYSKNETDLPPVLDFEDRNYNTVSDYLWRSQVWLEVVERETGRKPIVYTGNIIGDVLQDKKAEFLSRYPLWLAWYSRYLPKPPAPWRNYGWGAWQYSGKADFPFYANEQDGDGHDWGFDAYSMDVNWATDEFIALAGVPVIVPPVVIPPVEPPVILPPPPVFDNSADQHMARIAAQLRRLHS